jgi:hypothetical protein
MVPGPRLVGKRQAPADVLIGRVCPSWQGHWMAAVRLSHKRVFLGEGIMIELIFARGSDPAQVKRLPPQGSGCDMMADSVVLLQTPAVAEPTEVGLS